MTYIFHSFNHHSNLVREYSHFPYFTDEETGIERSNSFPRTPQLKPQANIFKIHEVLQEPGEGIQTCWVSDVLSYPPHSEQKPLIHTELLLKSFLGQKYFATKKTKLKVRRHGMGSCHLDYMTLEKRVRQKPNSYTISGGLASE